MRIIFNLYNVGLANNGGSRTIIKTSETLSQLGHEVILFSNVPNRYTWHNISGVKFVLGNKCPNADILIATGFGSVKNVLESRAKKKYYYIRGFETWVTSEEKLLQSYKSLKCIVNSEWLHKYLLQNGINSKIVYPGLDFDIFYDINQKRENIIGALYSERHKTKKHVDAIVVSKMLGYKLVMLNRDIINPKPEELNRWYNNIKVWFSPSELEGLHNPPAESSLTSCGLVCTDAKRGGTRDYAIHEKTSLVYPRKDLKIAAEYIDRLMKNDELRKKLNDKMIEVLKNKIGTRKQNMLKLVEYFGE